MSQLIDRTGQRFGRLVVTEHAGKTSYGHHLWKCRCDCSKETVVLAGHLGKRTNSCGCLWRERVDTANRTHGMGGTRLYKSFKSAERRCQNPKDRGYPSYGGRGIQFLYPSIAVFIADVGYPPSDTHTLDRIDNGGHYEPGNCRWATPKQQGNNKRNNYLIAYQGRTQTLSQWAAELGIAKGTLCKRLKRGWPIERALTAPVQYVH